MGNDTFILAGADVILDAGGIDTVVTSDTYTLAAGLENLVLSAGSVSGTGNAAANVITGSTGANLLSGLDGDDSLAGGRGDDTLLGGLGADTLAGGKGRDVFRFATPGEGVDQILDFLGKDDAIEVSAAGFAPGQLFAGIDLAIAGRYAANATGTATAAQGQFVYNTTSHLLAWDADGTGAGAAVVFADLTGAKGWTVADIVVIA